LLESLQALLSKSALKPVSLEHWRATIARLYEGKERSTRDKMAQALREVIALIGPGTTGDITPEIVEEYARRPGAQATTDGLMSALRAALKIAHRRKWLDYHDFEGVKFRAAKKDRKKTKHHSRETIVKVLTYLEQDKSWEGQRLLTFATMLAYTGLRLRECLKLRVEDLDLERGFAFVRNRTGGIKTLSSEAPVPLPAALRPQLQAWLSQLVSCPWLFPKHNLQGPWLNGKQDYRPGGRLKAAGLACGVEGFLPHSLRHSLATHLATHGRLGSRQIQLVLRHSNQKTQEIYIGRELEDLERSVRDFSFA
jgi:integrase/recombinase XerD